MISVDSFTKVPPNFSLQDNGTSNEILIGNCQLWGAGIKVLGSNNSVRIGDRCKLGLSLVIKANNCSVTIGSDTTMMNVRMSLHESGRIDIGEDCMFSGDIIMDVSDMHSIIDIDTQERINPAQDILIKDKVWLGYGVMVLKGACIEEGAIFGAKSLVHGHYAGFTSYAGVPAKKIRENVSWSRDIV